MYKQRHTRVRHSGTAQQQGAALMIAMVLIFILSILGLTSMRSSALEHRLVGNALEKELTFQAAESAGEISLDVEANLLAVICSDQAVASDITEMDNNDVIDADATVSFGGQTPAVGFSIANGAGLVDYRFTTTGTANLNESGTTTSVTQGVLVLGARPNNGSC